jgi:hypothetical protein
MVTEWSSSLSHNFEACFASFQSSLKASGLAQIGSVVSQVPALAVGIACQTLDLASAKLCFVPRSINFRN